MLRIYQKNSSPMFITFEGSEGSGKTSQVPALVELLKQAGYNVLATREPGGTPIGNEIRQVILDLKNQEMHLRTEVLLLQAARAQNVEQVIKPHLAAGGIVICDRFADSSMAYQGYGYQQDLEILRSIIAYATDGLKPDLTLLFDLDVEEGLRRRNKGGEINRLDVYQVEFYQRVRQGYLQMACQEPGRWVKIDASGTSEEVRSRVAKVVLNRLGKL